MIIGHGVDLEETARISAALERFGQRYLNRIYTEDEILFCESKKNKIQLYTSFWAVKEATMKALGTGNRQGVKFKDIEVCHEITGKPYINLYGTAKKLADNIGADNIVVTMANIETTVFASVILEAVNQK